MECVYSIALVVYIPLLCRVGNATTRGANATRETVEHHGRTVTYLNESEIAAGPSPRSEDACHGNYETEARVILHGILDNRTYDMNVPPTGGADVIVDLIIQDIEDISEKSRSFNVDLLYSQIWLDTRLDYTKYNSSSCLDNITLSYKMVDSVWIPNVCFVNTMAASVHNSPTRNIFLVIYPNGTVWTNYRVKLTIPCEMDFTTFPMDVQRCLLVFESFSFNVARVRLEWRDPPLIWGLNKNRILPEFVFNNHRIFKDNCLYPTGMWDQLKVVFMFRRGIGFYVIQVYVPTIAIVVLSWTSFWLDKEALPARITLGTTSLMAIITQYGIVAQGLPKVSYVRSIDIWAFCCMGFIIMTVIELPIVAFCEKHRGRQLARESASRMARKRRFATTRRSKLTAKSREASRERCMTVAGQLAHMAIQGPIVFDCRTGHQCEGEDTQRRRGILASYAQAFRIKATSKVDHFSRFLFPGTFAMFNAMYWWYYKVLSMRLLDQMTKSNEARVPGCDGDFT